ncbi:hypothetical protein [Bailinhaonella thermotolerans]|uniref:Uncharacterized protein n=1 Tax=Bailinhaonella thermotolerans TaxID=1070861 RepID=A0A3A4B0Q1_9ACTN|nr:hypothetical protein [Bailinhaonella thermotolerans]RJL31020.1 hypothetical protein D5H75_21370 [Bailinhaonella thermotolerans]
MEGFPEWAVWRSDAGRVWATLRRGLTGEEWEAGCSRTVDGDDARRLAEALEEQRRRQAEARRLRRLRETAARRGAAS